MRLRCSICQGRPPFQKSSSPLGLSRFGIPWIGHLRGVKKRADLRQGFLGGGSWIATRDRIISAGLIDWGSPPGIIYLPQLPIGALFSFFFVGRVSL